MSRRTSSGPSHAPRHVPPERPGPAGGKRDANRQQRTQALAEASMKLFLARGIESVTIDEIASEAGVAKGSFYRYFHDKGEVVDALLAPTAGRMRAAFATCERALAAAGAGESLAGSYLTLAAELFDAVKQDPDSVRLYLQECRGPAAGERKAIVVLADEVLERATALAQVARDRGLLRPLDPRVSAAVVVGAVEQLLHRFLAGRWTQGVEEIPEAVISLVLDGMRPRPTKG